MTDGKALTVSIMERDAALFLEFKKAQEGLWAEGSAVVCLTHEGLEARIGRMRTGPAAHWLIRQSMSGQSRVFALGWQDSGELRIKTAGWRGVFLPKP